MYLLHIDKELFQIQVGPVEHCVAWNVSLYGRAVDVRMVICKSSVVSSLPCLVAFWDSIPTIMYMPPSRLPLPTSTWFYLLKHISDALQRFAGCLSTGEGKWAVALNCLIRLGCQVQRLTVYTGQPTCKTLCQ